ncbi:prolipoprotein diacylglyceryl transferase [Liberiplasma polymorphum]|jgi:phosphatidylglycerol---prolipoprotein diacylglyceryl transferase|uniref:prolipoprotein diacylglyceryl transferase n=1 Tax=Liberiplasma polymorphum TaxID=3374570 RepID=UPI0037752E88
MYDHLSIQALPNTINLGPISIPLYGLFIMLGILAALGLGLKEGKKIGVSSDDILDGLLIILPLALIGTRLWYVAFEWDQFKDYLPSIIGLQRDGSFDGLSGLAIHGGFFTAVIATYFYTKKKQIDLFKALDLLAPGFLIAQSFGRWGNFFNQEAHGGVIGGLLADGSVALSWDQQRAFLSNTLRLPEFIVNNMFFFPGAGGHGRQYYHPTFLYESMWNLVGFAIILVIRRMKFIRSGDLIGFYFVWYGVGRFFIEGLRTDSLYVWNTGLRTAQIVSILMVIGGAVFISFNHLKIKRKHYFEILEENSVQLETEVKS